jgi:hypothetical protein
VAPPPRPEPPDLDDFEGGDNRFDPRPLDDGSPTRIIATMVGIVGILLLGSLFWSALGSLMGALGALPQAVPVSRPAVVLTVPPAATAVVAVPTVLPSATPAAAATAAPTPTRVAAEPTATPQPSTTAEPSGRAPWVLLPQPAPGSKVNAGQITVEARGRGDAAITEIKLELDGAALPVTLEQRSDSIWRGAASVRVAAGQHAVRAIVLDEHGRTGSFRWSFDAGP